MQNTQISEQENAIAIENVPQNGGHFVLASMCVIDKPISINTLHVDISMDKLK